MRLDFFETIRSSIQLPEDKEVLIIRYVSIHFFEKMFGFKVDVLGGDDRDWSAKFIYKDSLYEIWGSDAYGLVNIEKK